MKHYIRKGMTFAPRIAAIVLVLYAVSALAQTATDVGSGFTQAGASGTTNYARLTGQDANGFGTPEANLLGLKDNSVNLTPDPTCANAGTSGEITWIDSTESSTVSANTWDVCVDTIKVMRLEDTAVRVSEAFSADKSFLAGNCGDATYTCQLGAARAVIGSEAPEDMNLLLYHASATNFAGIAAQTAGHTIFVGGTSSPTTNAIVDNINGYLGVRALNTATATDLCYKNETYTNTFSTLSTCSSSRRYKEDIRPIPDGELDRALQIEPVLFSWKEDGRPDAGVIAEDVAELLPDAVDRNDKGQIESVRNRAIVAYLLGIVRRQERRIGALEAALGER